ncbi:MAG: hypothetical protein IPP48_02500 [Chitinophagaceae bacterium]|nr:hypothetical protein [Chitinophagaceae bacterium]
MKNLFLGCILLLSGYKLTAQNVGIGTTTPVAKLHVADESVLFSASASLPASPVNPPIEGGGRRLMWYVDKAAFRAGIAFGNQWDKDSIGFMSIGLGNSTKAKGESSFASGSGTNATGNFSTAMGAVSTASGNYTTAIGFTANASGDFSVALGSNAKSKGIGSVALGGNTAFGNYTTSTGYLTKATSDYSFVTGLFNDTTVANSLFEIGNGVTHNIRSNAVTVLLNGNTGIGVLNPTEKLEVAGKTKTTSLQVTTGAAPGKILTSDAVGNASWQTSNVNTGVEASASSTQTILSGSLTTVAFDTEHTDPAGAYNPVSSNWVIPSAGFYHINSAVRFFTPLPSNTDVSITINVNGLITKRKVTKVTGQSTIDISADVFVSANDIIDVYILQNSGSAVTLFTGRDHTYLSGFKVY